MGQGPEQQQWSNPLTGGRSAPAHASQPLIPPVPDNRANESYTQPVHDRATSSGEMQAHSDGAASSGRNAQFSLPDAVTIPLEHLWRPRTATTMPDSPTVTDLPSLRRAVWLAPWERARTRPGTSSDAHTETQALIGLLISIGLVLLIVTIALSVVLIQVAHFTTISGNPQTGPQSAAGRSARPTPTVTATLAPSPTAPPSTNSAVFVATDTTTLGSWQGVYGAAGYVMAPDTQQLPDALQVAPDNASQFTWADSTSDPRGLQKADLSADRIAACWYSPISFTIDVNITDGQIYQLALYLVDWDQLNRAERVDVLDPDSNTLLDGRNVTAFGSGVYLVWKVRGHITLQITNDPGSTNAVVSGLFFAQAQA